MAADRGGGAGGARAAAALALVAVAAALACSSAERVKTAIKINDPAKQYRYAAQTWGAPTQAAPPTPFRPAAAVSGPPMLFGMASRCYSYTDDQYQYELCPFRNVTQRDKSLAPGSLHVIMGLWGRYDVKDNAYAAMLFDDGTACGSGTRRSTRVNLECGNRLTVSRVTEPATCSYDMVFTMPQACNNGLSLGGIDDAGLVAAIIEDDSSEDDGPAHVVIIPAGASGSAHAANDEPSLMPEPGPEPEPSGQAAGGESGAGGGEVRVVERVVAPGDYTLLKDTVAEQRTQLANMHSCIRALAGVIAADPKSDTPSLDSCVPFVDTL